MGSLPAVTLFSFPSLYPVLFHINESRSRTGVPEKCRFINSWRHGLVKGTEKSLQFFTVTGINTCNFLFCVQFGVAALEVCIRVWRFFFVACVIWKFATYSPRTWKNYNKKSSSLLHLVSKYDTEYEHYWTLFLKADTLPFHCVMLICNHIRHLRGVVMYSWII